MQTIARANLVYDEGGNKGKSKGGDGEDCNPVEKLEEMVVELAARDVFRKYKALYPDEVAKLYTPEFNAIEAVDDQLNQKTKTADISEVMRRLQQEVSMSVSTRINDVRDGDYVDLSTLDFDRLRAAFAKSSIKNAVVFDL
ncbi:hypothetical protein MNBD_GAMMA26-2575 [hydrothermal vent metagenome]|uniref:Uncharacterized protein n=1 Tax=hydrothermal vent metagenome TaxID=652676 RepID=A0A3B1B0I5_9ZZZZ